MIEKKQKVLHREFSATSINYICQNLNCLERPTHGEYGGSPILCDLHAQKHNEGCGKDERVVDIDKKCDFRNCLHKATMQEPFQPGKFPFFACHKHSGTGYKEFRNNMCEKGSCGEKAEYGFFSYNKRFCRAHQLPGMVKLVNKCCKYKRCNEAAEFGYMGLTAVACESHKRKRMLHIDLLKCSFKDCNKYANWMNLTKDSRSCFEHQTINENQQIAQLFCFNPNCFEPAHYLGKGRKLERSKYCAMHSEMQKPRTSFGSSDEGILENNLSKTKTPKRRRSNKGSQDGQVSMDESALDEQKWIKKYVSMHLETFGSIDSECGARVSVLNAHELNKSSISGEKKGSPGGRKEKENQITYQFGKKRKATSDLEDDSVNVILQPNDYVDTLIINLSQPVDVGLNATQTDKCTVS